MVQIFSLRISPHSFTHLVIKYTSNIAYTHARALAHTLTGMPIYLNGLRAGEDSRCGRKTGAWPPRTTLDGQRCRENTPQLWTSLQQRLCLPTRVWTYIGADIDLAT